MSSEDMKTNNSSETIMIPIKDYHNMADVLAIVNAYNTLRQDNPVEPIHSDDSIETVVGKLILMIFT